jgi:RDD family
LIVAVIGAVAFVLGSILYFVIFWCTTGQTPGARVLQIRVVSAGGARVTPRWAVVRCARAVDRRRQPREEAGDPRGFPATAAGRVALSLALIRFG